MFNLLDVNGDKLISSSDIVEIQENIVPSSVIGQEIQMLADHYVDTRIKSTLLRDNDLIDIVTYKILVLRSCLCDELKSRLLSKPGKLWTFSVFQGRGNELEAKEIKRGVQKRMQVFRV